MVPRPHGGRGFRTPSKFGALPGRAGSARPVERERPSRPYPTAVRDRSSTPSVAPQGVGWRPPLSEPETVRRGRADGVQTHTGSASSGGRWNGPISPLSTVAAAGPGTGRPQRSRGATEALDRSPPDGSLGALPPMPLGEANGPRGPLPLADARCMPPTGPSIQAVSRHGPSQSLVRPEGNRMPPPCRSWTGWGTGPRGHRSIV